MPKALGWTVNTEEGVVVLGHTDHYTGFRLRTSYVHINRFLSSSLTGSSVLKYPQLTFPFAP